MKNHRFPALLLSLVLTFSLAAPAWAAEEDISSPPVETEGEAETGYLDFTAFTAQYLKEHPELLEGFDADAYFEENYYHYDKANFMDWHSLADEDQFVAYLWLEWSQYYYFEEKPSPYDTVEAAYREYMVSAYSKAHPDEMEGLDLDALLARLGYTETLPPMEQFMKDYDLSDKDTARTQLKYIYVNRRLRVEETRALARQYREEYPDKWDEFDPDGYFETKNEGYYPSKEACMESADLRSQEEFADFLFVEYIENNRWLWEMENGKWGQTYTPEPSLVVNGQTYAGNSFTLVAGTSYLASDELSAILGTTLETSGETPAPIRAAAEAAGWDVVWNEYHRQVILLDREKLMTGYIIPYTWEYVPCGFSGYAELIGRLNDAQPGKGRSLRSKEAYDITLTLMDSLDGDETYHFGLDGEMLSRDQVYNLDLTLDLAGLRELLGEELLEDLLASLSPVDRETFLENLGNLRFRAIWDQGEGNLAWNLPVLSLLEPSFDPETWFVQSTNAGSLSGMENMDLSDPGALNELLYTVLLEDCATNDSRWSDGETIYQSFLTSKAFLNALAGDGAITREGEDLVWDLTGGMTSLWGTAYNSIYYYGDIPEFTDLFREFTCRLTVAPDGTMSADIHIRPDMDAIAQASANEWDSPAETAMTAFLLNVVDFRYTAQGQSKGGTGTAHMEFQLKNQFKLTVDVNSEAQGSDDLPLTQPPQDSPVQSL